MLAIRKAESKDFRTIVNIMKESASHDELRGFVPPEGISSKFLEELENEIKRSDSSVIVAEKGKIPIGFTYYRCKNNFIEIEEIDVIKEYQGQGIGKALIQHIEEIAKEKGIKRLVAGTAVNCEGKTWKAYGFWIHMGFEDTGKRIQGPHGLKYVRFLKQVKT